MSGYIKYRFTKEAENTAGIVISYDAFCKRSIEDLSRVFPYSECLKMGRLEISDVYQTELEAMNHEFFCTWNGGKNRKGLK